jgi:hypothetical protein
MNKSVYTTITNEQFYLLLQDALRHEESRSDSLSLEPDEIALNSFRYWTINPNCKPGDLVALYVKAPVSAVVAIGTVATRPELCEVVKSEWYGSHFSEMHSVQMLTEPIQRITLIDCFPLWRYWRQPRNSSRVPDHFQNQFYDLLRRLLTTSRV